MSIFSLETRNFIFFIGCIFVNKTQNFCLRSFKFKLNLQNIFYILPDCYIASLTMFENEFTVEMWMFISSILEMLLQFTILEWSNHFWHQRNVIFILRLNVQTTIVYKSMNIIIIRKPYSIFIKGLFIFGFKDALSMWKQKQKFRFS